MAALLVERSYVDLRSQVTVGGVCSLPASDIKYMVADNSRSKVWSASSLTFALWYAFLNFPVFFARLKFFSLRK